MQTDITDERAAQLKAEAIAARRASRSAWRNEHYDRQEREREARRVSREYRDAQRNAQGPTKSCTKCLQALPLDAFVVHRSGPKQGRTTSRCKACLSAAKRAAYQPKPRAVKLPKPKATKAPEGMKHCGGCLKTLPKDAFATFRQGGKLRIRPRCKPCRAAENSAAYQGKRQATASERHRKAAEARRKAQLKAAERIARLSALLSGTDPLKRIESDEEWDVTASELRKLWHLSGDKECISCKAIVPPTAMLPPGPGNFYTGKCRSCTAEEYRERHLAVFGKELEGPRPIRLKDGSTVTIGDIARHHRELEQSYRVKRWSGRVNLGMA